MDETGVFARPEISMAGADAIVKAAVEEARAMGTPITVVVVDGTGVVKAVRRMDGAPVVSLGTATGKARAAAIIGMAPDEFYEAVRADGAAVAYFTTHQDIALIAGGLPIRSGGAIAGGVGVAGAMTGADDRKIAQAALSALGG